MSISQMPTNSSLINNQAVKRFGMTDPISTAYPTDLDITLTDQLIATLRAANFFEDEDESLKREIVLGKLNALVKDFVKTIAMEQGMSENVAIETGGKIYSFGSYRLGVHSKGADIDTLCVVPQHVSRADFFGSFYAILRDISEVTDLAQVPDAYVPVIKLVFDGIPLDILFAQLSMPTIPEDLSLLDTSIMKNLDDKCVVSLNGSRTTDEILSLVPNIQTFHTSLRCIKLWAKRRGLYNNSMGYIAGVACAILTARICQLYPNASASVIVSRFFSIYSAWLWPQPIMLRRIEYDSPIAVKLNSRVWNPRSNMTDRNHKMPIITPAFPSMCSTHNVNNSTFALMKYELNRGKMIMSDIDEGKASWDKLLERTDYFFRFRQFIQIIAVAKSPEDSQIWKGYVESKLRLLVARLESSVPHLTGAPPFPDSYSQIIEAENAEQVLNHLIYSESSSNSVVTDSPKSDISSTSTSTTTYYATCYYLALEIEPISISAPGPRRLNLAVPVADFKRLLLSWEKTKPDMEIFLRQIKRAQLPDVCFEGLPRPLPIPGKKIDSVDNANGKVGVEEACRQNLVTDDHPPKKLKI